MKKYFLAGTFDNFHVGHQYLIWTALEKIKNNGEGELVVLVARDKTVEKIKNYFPVNSEEKRIKRLESEFENFKFNKKIKIKIRLGRKDRNFQLTLEEESPEYIFLGYDQHFDENILEKINQKKSEYVGEIINRPSKINLIRLKPYKENFFKSSKFRKKI